MNRPNVLLITLDTTRADRIGAYGFEQARTPRLDELARSGVRVAHAISTAPITATAHSSILTGLLPPAHGVRSNGSFRLPDEIQTLPEVLGAGGYATAAFVSAAVLDSRYNLSQGFDTYDDNLWSEDTPAMFMIRERKGARTAERAIAWLRAQRAEHAAQPFFVWVHFFDVHEPHEPDAADSKLGRSGYDAEITGVDRHVGALLDALTELQLAEQTLVAVTADHGESLGEHGESTHGIFVYESTLHIPLLLRWPGHLPVGSVYRGPMHQIDLFPTLLAATASEAPTNQGANLLDALAGKAPAPALAQYSESKLSELGFGMAPLHAVRLGDYTYVRAPRPELYDRSSDPQESRNLNAARPEVAAKLSAELDRLLRESEARGFEASQSPVDRQTEEMLRALGYVGDAQTKKEVAALDPKDGIELYEQLHRARQLARTSRDAEAMAILKSLLAIAPRHLSALNLLAMCELRSGDFDSAKRHYAESLAIEPSQPRVHVQLANALLDRRQLDDALKAGKEAIRQSPDFVEALVVLGFIEMRRGHRAEADAYYARAQTADPHFPRAAHAYADMFFRQQDYANALAYYLKALERAPKNFEAMVQAGASARRIGDLEGAQKYYRRAAELRPDAWIPPYNLACVHALMGQRAAALVELKLAVSSSIPDPGLLLRDPDFESLRTDAAFIALATDAKSSRAAPPRGGVSAAGETKRASR